MASIRRPMISKSSAGPSDEVNLACSRERMTYSRRKLFIRE